MIPFCTTSLNTLSFKISWNRIHAKEKKLNKSFRYFYSSICTLDEIVKKNFKK